MLYEPHAVGASGEFSHLLDAVPARTHGVYCTLPYNSQPACWVSNRADHDKQRHWRELQSCRPAAYAI